MRARAVAAAALLGLALGLLAPACGATGGAGSPATTSAPAPAVAEPTTIPAGAPAVVLATYVRSGGPAGRRFQVVVRPDGSFEGGSGKPGRGHLGGASLDDLQELVVAFAAAAPTATYGTGRPDGLTTSVSAGGASTSVLSGASPPAPVARLVGFLASLERQLPR